MESAHLSDCQEREQHAWLSTEKPQSKQRGYKESWLSLTCETRFGVLLYCMEPTHPEAKQTLEMVQRRASRYVTNRYRNTSSVTSMLDHLQWEPLESRRTKHRLAMMFKILHGLGDKYLTPASKRTRSQHGQKFRHIQASSNYLTTTSIDFFSATVRHYAMALWAFGFESQWFKDQTSSSFGIIII